MRSLLDPVCGLTYRTLDESGAFRLIAKTPAQVADLVFIQKSDPRISLGLIQASVSGGIGDTKLGDKEGQAFIESLLGLVPKPRNPWVPA